MISTERVRIRSNKKLISLGTYKNIKDAIEARESRD